MTIVSDKVGVLSCRNVVAVPVVKVIGDPIPFANSCLLHLVVGNRGVMIP